MKMRWLIVIATLSFITSARAEIFNYVCMDSGKPYPLKVDDKQGTLVWKGSAYKIKVKEDCGRTGWHADRPGASFDFCTATKGYADFEENGVRIQCDLKRSSPSESAPIPYSKQPAPTSDGGNRLIKTMPDGVRIFSKHSLVGRCKISDGAILPCASSEVNGEFSLKYDGYWFSNTHEKSLYGTDKTVADFNENAVVTCLGKVSESQQREVVVGPPNRNNDSESICVINKSDAPQVIETCKIGQSCKVVGYVGADCEGECANIVYVISINGNSRTIGNAIAQPLSQSASINCQKVSLNPKSSLVSRILCSGKDGASADWDLNAVLWAIAGGNDDLHNKAFDQEQENWRSRLNEKCSIEKTSRATDATPSQRQCVITGFHDRAKLVRSRLSGLALAESEQTPERRAQAQSVLQARDFFGVR